VFLTKIEFRLSDLLCYTLIDCIGVKCSPNVTAITQSAWFNVTVITGICQRIVSKVKYDITKQQRAFIKITINNNVYY
jgi:hypothetical protein